MEYLKAFYKEHKKGVWITIGLLSFYSIGYHKGYRAYKKIVVDTARIIKKEFNIIF